MNNKRVRTKAMAMAVAAAMAVELCPVTAFAVTGDQVAADGTYEGTAQAVSDSYWNSYNVSAKVTVKDGKIETVEVTPQEGYASEEDDEENESYFNKAYSGTAKVAGMKTKLENQDATQNKIAQVDTVSHATRTSTAIKNAVLTALQSAPEKSTTVKIDTTVLEAAIVTAEGKTEADYTADSWKAMQEKLTAAKAALEAKESQEAVDAAQTALDAAVAALEAKPSEPEKPDVTTGTYVLMNIPYDQFYAADVNNSVKVDAFTSATKNKVRTAGLAGGSYHVDASGDEITGVTFPVKVGEGVDLSKYKQITDESSVDITVTNRGQTSTATYTGKDALFESASYSYYTLSETPKYYKEVTLNADGSLSLGKTQGTAQKVSGVTPELTTQTSYGDYQLNLDGLENTISQSDTQIYGVIVSTKEGNDYGMRHLENIWRVTELAWCTGFTTAVHNCPTSSAHYVNMMGQHINKVTYYTSHWSADGKEITLTNGNVIKFNRGEITDTDGTVTKLKDYEVTGLKYVPVKVASADYEAFCQKYNVVENGGELVGGYGEKKLAAYSVKANVTDATNGLKTVTKNEDGSFSFSARQAGSESGIEGQALKTAPDAEAAGLTVKNANGSYGEFLRVDLTGNYGDLGSNMQAVTWTYYGDDSTYSNAKATYGTKFAADNWMHKSMGIQLALTKSLRCTLPEGTDGTGYWTITIAALGYKDVTYQFQATDANIVKDKEEEVSTDELKKAIEAAEALIESDYTAKSWAAMQAELQEAKDELKDPKTQATVDEATQHLNAAIKALVKTQKETYVLMNIPYDEFYKADVNNDVKVDAFTSATKNKVRTGSLAGGSYHVDASGDEIIGVTFPVKVPAGTDLSKYTQITDDSKVSITVTNRGQESTTDYTGKDALFESASHSYYTLSEKPSYYKELTVNEDGTFSFGATQGTVTTITEGVTAELMTESKYGDYQLDLDGLTDTIPSGTAIYGVIVSTKEGSDYGMRHLENIWRVSELAWATGFTTAVHNCPTSSEHYKAMMGQHIDKVTYYTANGIYEIPVGGEKGLYVPVKFDTSAVAVADAELKDGETSVATTISGLTLPEGFDAEYTVEGATASVKGEKLILKDVKKGAYTLTITDKSGKYATINFRFEVYAETMPAAYNENSEKPGLTKAAGATDAEFADYIKNITSVSVNGKPYAVSGRNAVKLFNDDGTLITDAAPFAEGDSFEIVVTATGYKDLSFIYKKAAKEDPAKEINTASLEKAIQSAETLKEADYTADSWKVLQVALKNAKSALEAKKDQTSVDNAAASLNKAMEALVKADGSAATPTPTTTPTTTPAASKNNTTTSGTGNKTTTSSGSTSSSKTAKTGDPTNIFEMLGLAVASLGTGGFALKRRKRNKK